MEGAYTLALLMYIPHLNVKIKGIDIKIYPSISKSW
jgi:hypothetical protein